MPFHSSRPVCPTPSSLGKCTCDVRQVADDLTAMAGPMSGKPSLPIHTCSHCPTLRQYGNLPIISDFIEMPCTWNGRQILRRCVPKSAGTASARSHHLFNCTRPGSRRGARATFCLGALVSNPVRSTCAQEFMASLFQMFSCNFVVPCPRSLGIAQQTGHAP